MGAVEAWPADADNVEIGPVLQVCATGPFAPGIRWDADVEWRTLDQEADRLGEDPPPLRHIFVQADALTRTYRRGSEDVHALLDVTLAIPASAFAVVLGRCTIREARNGRPSSGQGFAPRRACRRPSASSRPAACDERSGPAARASEGIAREGASRSYPSLSDVFWSRT